MRTATVLLLTTWLVIGCGSDDASDTSGSPGSGASGANGPGGSGATGDGGAGATGATGGSGGAGGAGGAVDATTLEGKLMFGYQGWFACPGDGSQPNRWVHWFGAQQPTADNATFDMWPDTSELDDDELFDTAMTYGDGTAARLYSAFTQKTVVRHFGWMKEHGIDGVFLQRFLSELGDPAFLQLRDQVALNAITGTEDHERVLALMYDVSGASEATLLADLQKDWAHMVDQLALTASARYLRHAGKPVLAIWGLGFDDRPGTAAQAAEIVAWFKSGAEQKYQVTLVGGVPREWRTLGTGSKTDPAWAAVYRSFDVLTPWTVGAYVDEAGADNYKDGTLAADLAEAEASGVAFMPVIFPGFSWTNLNGGPLNQIPRNGGAFWWRQFYNATSAGSTIVYGAMFDEVDEGTAMFKLAPNAASLPAQGTFLPLDADGIALPSDWYLRVAGEATRQLRGDTPLTATMPIAP